jgi:uncharacterized OB-fold protein
MECLKIKKLINPKWFSSSIDNIEDQEMIGSYCENCNKTYFPIKRVCPSCMTIDKMKQRPLSKLGKLYSFTVGEVGPTGFKTPYAFGWVDLPRDGIRLFSLLTDCEPFEKKLRVDMDVEMVIDVIKESEEGELLYGFKFRPVINKRGKK